MASHVGLANATACNAPSIPPPTLFGARVTSLEANWVSNYSLSIPQGTYASNHAFNVSEVSFCNISLHYTHPGYDDDVNVQVWLPEKWNGQFQGTGGGGFVVGLNPNAMSGAVGQGYASASSDGGHTTTVTENWVLKSPGNINWATVLNFGSQSLYDFTVLGKQITSSFYGQAPKYSYFTGCSTGGRQAMKIAQRWPDLYDGILAGAPGINYAELVSWLSYPEMIMHWSKSYPTPCETTALTRAAIAACDELDGVRDGIISNNEQCTFNPFDVVGQTVSCDGGGEAIISPVAAAVANATWGGARTSNGTFLWHGLNKDAPLSGLAATRCTGGTCSPAPFAIATEWPKYFVHKGDPSFDHKKRTPDEYSRDFLLSVMEYDSPLGSADPDIRAFGTTGGKIIMWQGLQDQLVPIGGTRQYYEISAKI